MLLLEVSCRPTPRRCAAPRTSQYTDSWLHRSLKLVSYTCDLFGIIPALYARRCFDQYICLNICFCLKYDICCRGKEFFILRHSRVQGAAWTSRWIGGRSVH